MKLVIVRHGDPNYELDTLTETGWKEAKLVSERICKLDVKEFYVSPLGRARDTASCTLKKLNRTAITCDWLREFDPRILRPDANGTPMICWDWLPSDWTKEDCFYNENTWTDHPLMQQGNVKKEFDWVCNSLDALLKEHGYEREGRIYRAVAPNNDTLVFFCHFGLECVLIGHLTGISPMQLWHGFSAAPTSVTTISTEERREGFASFRVNSFGDISHLYAANQEPSFSARFCECYKNSEERHD